MATPLDHDGHGIMPSVTIGAALAARWEQLHPGEPLNWVFQTRHEGRSETRLMAGSVPDPHVVTEVGVRFERWEAAAPVTPGTARR